MSPHYKDIINMNKSFLTNLIALSITITGFFIPIGGDIIKSAGIFALSGALTNWIAVYMLFEKIPLLYGSGVIPMHFEEFKTGIRSLLMNQFFTEENIDRLLKEETSLSDEEKYKIIDSIDYNRLFDGLKANLLSGGIGPMLKMVGGDMLIEKYRGEAVSAFRNVISEELFSPKEGDFISKIFDSESKKKTLLKNVDQIVEARLNELTPKRVKEIIQEMIRKHLGWLVVWGGLLGGIIGVIAAFSSAV